MWGSWTLLLKIIIISYLKMITYRQNWKCIPWQTEPMLLHLKIDYKWNYRAIIKSFISMSPQWANLAISVVIWHHITLIPPLYCLLACHLSKICHIDSKCIPFWESQTYSDHFFTLRTNFLIFRSNSIMFITIGCL